MKSPLDVMVERWCADTGTTAYTPNQAAQMVGRSKDTLARWRRNGDVVPSLLLEVGDLSIHLYTPDDIIALHAMAESSYSGKRNDLDRR